MYCSFSLQSCLHWTLKSGRAGESADGDCLRDGVLGEGAWLQAPPGVCRGCICQAVCGRRAVCPGPWGCASSSTQTPVAGACPSVRCRSWQRPSPPCQPRRPAQFGIGPNRLNHSLVLHVYKKYIQKLRPYTLPLVSKA